MGINCSGADGVASMASSWTGYLFAQTLAVDIVSSLKITTGSLLLHATLYATKQRHVKRLTADDVTWKYILLILYCRMWLMVYVAHNHPRTKRINVNEPELQYYWEVF